MVICTDYFEMAYTDEQLAQFANWQPNYER